MAEGILKCAAAAEITRCRGVIPRIWLNPSSMSLLTCPTADLRTLGNLKIVRGTEENVATPVRVNSSLARLGFYLFSEETPPQGMPD
jgi:hypothetical protein